MVRFQRIESKLRRHGWRLICGVDEAGRGPLAGPVVAAAVILPDDFSGGGIDDSKKLSEKQRQEQYEKIVAFSRAYAFGIATSEEIDQINILQATFLAMRRAIANLPLRPGYILVDGHLRIPQLELPQETIIGGDGRVLSIAAASILAKVHRDNLMREYHLQYPVYGFDRHKGYPTEKHRLMIRRHGTVEIHRKSFDLLGRQLELVINPPAEARSTPGDNH